MKKIHLLLLLSLLHCYAFGQRDRFAYWDDPKGMIATQTGILLAEIENHLIKHPPAPSNDSGRKLALYTLDAIYHDERTDGSNAVKDFFERRYLRVAEDLSSRSGDPKMTVYKLYNHGFIIRTATATFGFDVVTGPYKQDKRTPLVSDSTIHRLIDQCDVLFVSHFHADHADEAVARYSLEKGKTVVAPEGLWDNLKGKLLHLRKDHVFDQQLEMQNGHALKVHVLPGHQGDRVLNNIYIVTTEEGHSVAHTGDQANEKDLEWISDVSKTVSTDVLLVNCWNQHISEIVRGLNPRLIIPGHENELAHSIDHREPHWLTYQHVKDIGKPYVLMTAGEYYKVTK